MLKIRLAWLGKLIFAAHLSLSPTYAAARLWVDAVIDPLETRKVISEGIAAANHAPIEKAYNVVVIQV